MDNNKLIIKPKPVKGEDGYLTFSVRLREELVDRLDDISARSGHSRNQLIATFLEYALDNCEILDAE